MSEQTPQNENKEQTTSESTSQNNKESKQKEQKYYDKRFEEREIRRTYRGSDGIGVGVTFIFIGIVWMMSKLGYLNFSIIGAVVDLWPLIFIVIGVNMIFRRVPYIGLITWVGFLSAIVAYGVYFAPQDHWIEFGNSNNTQSIISESGTSTGVIAPESGNFGITGNEGVKKAELTLDMSAGDLIMGATESNMLDYVVPSELVTVESTINNDKAQFQFEEKNNIHKFRNQKRNFDFYLNPNILWHVEVNAGALNSDMNFSSVPMEYLEINSGAGDFDLVLGELQDKSDVNINIAAGDLNLTVPKNVGLRIEANDLLGDQNFSEAGLVKINGYYQTTDYDSSTKVIYIELNSAVSDVNLVRK